MRSLTWNRAVVIVGAVGLAVLGVAIVLVFTGRSSGPSIQQPDHGDPPPKNIVLARGFAGTPPPVQCVDASDPFRFEVVLVTPPSSQGITPAVARDAIQQANGYVNEAAASQGHTARLRVLCDSTGQIKVGLVSVADQPLDFGGVVRDAQAAGYSVADVHYAIFYNGLNGYGAAGVGNIGSELGGTAYAVAFGYAQGELILHEMTHTLGAVQGTEHAPAAPHSTWAGHCFDGLDIECYNDGGLRGAQQRLCFSTVWDCGHDDYAGITPPAGSWLAQHPEWNALSCQDRYIAVSGCPGVVIPPTTTTSTTPPTSTTTTPPPTSTVPPTSTTTTTTPPPTSLPAPTNYRVTLKSCTSLGIAWDPVSGATSYVVQRKLSTASTWTYLARLPYPRFNSSWSANGTYTYRSAGVDSSGRQGAYGQIVVTRSC